MGEEGSTAAPHNHWYELPAWPPAYTGQAYYLSYSTEGQLLASIPPHHTQDFQSDPANPVATLGGANLSNSLLASAGPYDQTPVESHPDILKFRSSMLPVDRRYPIQELMDACQEYVDKTNRRIKSEAKRS